MVAGIPHVQDAGFVESEPNRAAQSGRCRWSAVTRKVWCRHIGASSSGNRGYHSAPVDLSYAFSDEIGDKEVAIAVGDQPGRAKEISLGCRPIVTGPALTDHCGFRSSGDGHHGTVRRQPEHVSAQKVGEEHRAVRGDQYTIRSHHSRGWCTSRQHVVARGDEGTARVDEGDDDSKREKNRDDACSPLAGPLGGSRAGTLHRPFTHWDGPDHARSQAERRRLDLERLVHPIPNQFVHYVKASIGLKKGRIAVMPRLMRDFAVPIGMPAIAATSFSGR